MRAYQEREYSDIINLLHHVSKKHKQMHLLDRAAQFSPFAALTGYEDAINETARLVDEQIILDEDEKALLDTKFQELKMCISEQPKVSITYFKADKYKQGGSYETISGQIKKIDEIGRFIILTNGEQIFLEQVIRIEKIC